MICGVHKGVKAQGVLFKPSYSIYKQRGAHKYTGEADVPEQCNHVVPVVVDQTE